MEDQEREQSSKTIKELSNVKVKRSRFSGFTTAKEKWSDVSHTAKFYIYNTAGALAMALDGALAGDMSTVQTGVLNAAKNAAFFPVRKGLSKHFKEPEATLRSDFWSSAASVATNLPQFIGNYKTFEKIFEPDGLVEATLSGDLTRATVGLLAVSAYSIQTIYNGKKLIDYKKEKAPWEDFSEATKSETSLWDKFIENGKEITGKAIDGAGKYIPSNALLLRSMNMIVMGAVTGNAAQIVSGIGFMKGARHRGHANKAHDVVNDLVGSELLGEDLDSVYDLPDINVIIERGMHHQTVKPPRRLPPNGNDLN